MVKIKDPDPSKLSRTAKRRLPDILALLSAKERGVFDRARHAWWCDKLFSLVVEVNFDA